MKRTIVAAFLLEIAVSGDAQGLVALDNAQNESTNTAATANGLFWVSTGGLPALVNQDFNAAFYGAANSNSLAPIAVFLLSNGTAAHDNPLPGLFADPMGLSYPISGSLVSAFFQIQAWTGNFNSYAAAVSGGAFAAQSPIFGNPVDVPPGDTPDLVGMPAIVLSVPEPGSFALLFLGAASLLTRRRWRP